MSETGWIQGANRDRAAYSASQNTKIVLVEWPSFGKVRLTLSCGHTSEPNPIYAYRAGDVYRCFRCDEESKRCRK